MQNETSSHELLVLTGVVTQKTRMTTMLTWDLTNTHSQLQHVDAINLFLECKLVKCIH